jgi:hypothetical protein
MPLCHNRHNAQDEYHLKRRNNPLHANIVDDEILEMKGGGRILWE